MLHKLHLSCENPSRKKLSPGDVNPLIAHRNALLVPRDLATRNIIPCVNESNENPRNGIPIRVYDTYRGQYRLSFLRGNDEKYLITHGPAEEDQSWSDVVQGAGLQEGDFIKLWTLRHDETNQLCFVIEREAQVSVCLFTLVSAFTLFFALICFL